MARLVRSQLAEIGLDVVVDTTSLGHLGETLAAGDYDLIIFSWIRQPERFLGSAYQFWNSEGGGNFGGYRDTEVDRLTNDAVVQINARDAASLANQAAAIVAADAYVLPISNQPLYAFVSDRYVNIRPNQGPAGMFYNSHEWGLASSGGG